MNRESHKLVKFICFFAVFKVISEIVVRLFGTARRSGSEDLELETRHPEEIEHFKYANPNIITLIVMRKIFVELLSSLFDLCSKL